MAAGPAASKIELENSTDSCFVTGFVLGAQGLLRRLSFRHRAAIHSLARSQSSEASENGSLAAN
jgi:hypothetical protein